MLMEEDNDMDPLHEFCNSLLVRKDGNITKKSEIEEET